jgi:hypothetical protein
VLSFRYVRSCLRSGSPARTRAVRSVSCRSRGVRHTLTILSSFRGPYVVVCRRFASARAAVRVRPMASHQAAISSSARCRSPAPAGSNQRCPSPPSVRPTVSPVDAEFCLPVGRQSPARRARVTSRCIRSARVVAMHCVCVCLWLPAQRQGCKCLVRASVSTQGGVPTLLLLNSSGQQLD